MSLYDKDENGHLIISCSFVWWYFDYYLVDDKTVLDAFGWYGAQKCYRIILTHIRLRGSSLSKEVQLFSSNSDEWDRRYDVFAQY